MHVGRILLRAIIPSVILTTFVAVPVLAQTEGQAQAGSKHEFLKQFVGEWETESEAIMVPGQPAVKSKGTMTATMLGDNWALLVVKGEAMGQVYDGRSTLGYDSNNKKKYIGTWVDSLTDFMWHYEGTVEGNKLMLDTKGPSPYEPGKMIKARDTWEFKSKDEVVLTSEMEGADGKMMKTMTAKCTRKK